MFRWGLWTIPSLSEVETDSKSATVTTVCPFHLCHTRCPSLQTSALLVPARGNNKVVHSTRCVMAWASEQQGRTNVQAPINLSGSLHSPRRRTTRYSSSRPLRQITCHETPQLTSRVRSLRTPRRNNPSKHNFLVARGTPCWVPCGCIPRLLRNLGCCGDKREESGPRRGGPKNRSCVTRFP